MNGDIQTTGSAGEFISEAAVRGVFGRGRRSQCMNRATVTDPGRPTRAGAPVAEQRPDAGAASIRRVVPRRRWSVAELVARAAVAPRAL